MPMTCWGDALYSRVCSQADKCCTKRGARCQVFFGLLRLFIVHGITKTVLYLTAETTYWPVQEMGIEVYNCREACQRRKIT